MILFCNFDKIITRNVFEKHKNENIYIYVCVFVCQ